MPSPAGPGPVTASGCPLDTLAAVARAPAPPAAGADPSTPLLVTGVTLDSRAVSPGDLYAALPGARTHGATFARQAAAAGAVALLTDARGQELAGRELPALVVADPRAVLGELAAQVYGHPARDLQVLAVTGTNGKTTTTYLLDAALRAMGRTTGLVGTIETRIGDQRVPSVRTTPEAPDLHALLAAMRERGVQVVSMEVSSQALAQHRADAVVADVAGFTSFSQEHLDLHGDMATYLAAKALLFTPEHSRQGVVVVDDEGGRAVAQRASVPVTTISAGADPDADWVVTGSLFQGAGTTFTLQHRRSELTLGLTCPLPGHFNVMNMALAAVMLLQAGRPEHEVVRGLSGAGGVPGRMERVGGERPDAPLAVVDYAHSPAAVAAALAALRPAARRRLVVVLGAGGDRDPGKRAAMGAAAATGADVVVVTDDNPRSEDPAVIRAALRSGAEAAAARLGRPTEVLEVADRGAAIRHAVACTGAGDVLLLAGKGHEQGQEAGGVVHPFDDRVELAAALAEVGR